MTKEDNTMKFKVIVMGERNVGKTCLMHRYCNGQFPDDVCSTIGVDFQNKVVDANGTKVTLQIWDTAGQERFLHSMTDHLFRNAKAVVFVYDVTCQNSFLRLNWWIDVCKQHELTPEKVPCIIVGNKSELKGNHAVSMQTAMMFADSHLMPLFVTSAKEDSESDNVNDIFDTLARHLVNKKIYVKTNEGFVLTDAPGSEQKGIQQKKGGCC